MLRFSGFYFPDILRLLLVIGDIINECIFDGVYIRWGLFFQVLSSFEIVDIAISVIHYVFILLFDQFFEYFVMIVVLFD